MKLSYILLLSVSATRQAIAAKTVDLDTQSGSEVVGNGKIGAGEQYLQDIKGPNRLALVHALYSPLGENFEIQANMKRGNKSAKGTPDTGKPAKGKPTKGTPAKPTQAKPELAKPTPSPKTSLKEKTGKCKRQVTMRPSSSKGKPIKGNPTKGKPSGKDKAVKRTYIDFLKPKDARTAPMAFQTVAVRT